MTVDAEDFADILLDFNKCAVNLHLNFFSRLLKREIILDFKDHTIVADLVSSKITILKDKNKRIIKKFKFERDDMYLSQLNYFFNNLKKSNTMNDLDESLKIFDIIIEIKKGIKK